MYDTILVGIDDSEFSKSALIEVSNWVKRNGGKIVLVHAVYFDEEEFSIASEQLEKRFEIGKKVCIQRKKILSSEFGLNGNVESLVCEGEPPDVIVDIAKEKKADLIALGTYGRKGLRRLFMGSVTSGVIVNSPCDVLVVKKPCIECRGRYNSILLPFDGSEFSKKALNQACRLSQADGAVSQNNGADVTVLYVIPRYEEMIDFLKTSSIKQSMMQEALKITNQARELALRHGVSVKTEIIEGQAAEKIIETSNRMKNDLIVMGSYGWRGVSKAILGSTAERVIMNASCPVLVVR